MRNCWSAGCFCRCCGLCLYPAVEYGEREIDIKYGTASSQAGNPAKVASIGLGFGAKEYWFTEIYLKQVRSGNTEVTLAEWENKFQLTETGNIRLILALSSKRKPR